MGDTKAKTYSVVARYFARTPAAWRSFFVVLSTHDTFFEARDAFKLVSRKQLAQGYKKKPGETLEEIRLEIYKGARRIRPTIRFPF
jgi:hypothetical protein